MLLPYKYIYLFIL